MLSFSVKGTNGEMGGGDNTDIRVDKFDLDSVVTMISFLKSCFNFYHNVSSA